MKEEIKNIFANGNLEFKKVDHIGVISIKKNIFEIITDLSESTEFFDILERTKFEQDIHAILIINESGCLDSSKYTEFLKMVVDEDKQDGFKLSSGVARSRQIVNLNNFIRRTVVFDKLIFMALQGEIVTPFLGASLAADFRFAAEDVCFSLCHLKMGVHPAGALPYFLPKYIGQSKVAEILYGGKDISCKEALELGLVNKVFTKDNFEEQCIQEIENMIDGRANVLSCTKKLLTFSIKDLEEYISSEECKYIRS